MSIYVLWHNETILARVEERGRRSPFAGKC